jgi:putative transposase
MRSITRSYRIRAYPNGAQRRLLESWFGASRWLWNTTLGIRSEAYRVCGLNQDAAFRNFFARRALYPKFKRKSAAASLRFQGVGVAWARGIVSLPKLGSLKLAESLPKVERPDLVTLSRDAAGHYHVSFCAEVETALLRITHRVVGVDVGLTHLATQLVRQDPGDGGSLVSLEQDVLGMPVHPR